MPDKVKKYVVSKAVIKAIDAEKFTVDAVISTPTIDRDKEIITVDAIKKGIKEYKKHAVLLSSHVSYGDLRKQIGEAVKFKFEDDKVTSRFKYYVGEGNPEADWAFKLAEKGIAAYSIGFYPIEWEDCDFNKTGIWRKYTHIETLEVSQVLIPSNRGAYQANSFEGVGKELCAMAVKSMIDDDFSNQDEYFEKTYHKEDPDNGDTDNEKLPDVDTYDKKEVNDFIEKLTEEIKEIKEYIKENINPEIQPKPRKQHYSEFILGGQDPNEDLESKEAAPSTAQIVKGVFEEDKRAHVISNAIKEACQ